MLLLEHGIARAAVLFAKVLFKSNPPLLSPFARQIGTLKWPSSGGKRAVEKWQNAARDERDRSKKQLLTYTVFDKSR